MKVLVSVAAILAVSVSAASAATLQIESDNPPNWDRLSTIQTGTVGDVRVEASTTLGVWNTTFNDENTIGYTREAYFGDLSQPAGTTGDQFNQAVRNGNLFTTSIMFLDEIVDPIFYILDIDLVGASVTFTGGWSSIHVSADGSLFENTITALSGVLQDPATPGAHAAVQYAGTWSAGSTFDFLWDFTNAQASGGENVAIGIGTLMSGGGGGGGGDPQPNPIPLPAAGWLLIGGLAGLAGVRRTRAG